MQLIVNGTYGLALGVGLLALGVEYAFLWGFLAAVLRYVPYVGPWIASVFPLTLSLAASEGWWQPVSVLVLILVLELISNNMMEPWLYGHTIGVSEVGLLVCAAFWTFLWGPIGLVLSAPLTVCLVVLGKYVPRLEFLDILLGSQPALEPEVHFYQRLLARDYPEAKSVARRFLKRTKPEQVRDELIVPALQQARRDRERGELTEADEAFVFEAVRLVLHEVTQRERVLADAAAKAMRAEPPRVEKKARALFWPARDEMDHLSLEMLRQMLDPRHWDVEVVSDAALTGEMLDRLAESPPDLVCVGALPPGGVNHARYLCKRLRGRFPELKILAGRWGRDPHAEESEGLLKEAGADEVARTLVEARNYVLSLQPVLSEAEAPDVGPVSNRPEEPGRLQTGPTGS
jgi:hypothetical protein